MVFSLPHAANLNPDSMWSSARKVFPHLVRCPVWRISVARSPRRRERKQISVLWCFWAQRRFLLIVSVFSFIKLNLSALYHLDVLLLIHFYDSFQCFLFYYVIFFLPLLVSSPLFFSLLSLYLCLGAGVFLKHNKVWSCGACAWMLWLHWDGFLCGPPASFMIYSAKGRGARPPVTTEREPHVGLMISPQKCLLWLGLRGAKSPPTGWMRSWGAEKRAWLTGLIQYKSYCCICRCRDQDGRQSYIHWLVANILNSCLSANPKCFLRLCFSSLSILFFSLSLSVMYYWNVDT